MMPKEPKSRHGVKTVIQTILDENLPDSYDRIAFNKKCDSILETMIDYASKGTKWAS